MKLEEIIDLLCGHEISKNQALTEIKSITDGLRKNKAFEFTVIEVAFDTDGNGYLKLKLPYRYSEFENKTEVGDKVDVIFLP